MKAERGMRDGSVYNPQLLSEQALCRQRADRRRVDCAVLLPARRDTGIKALFLHRRRTVACRVRRDGDRRRAGTDQQYAAGADHHRGLRRTAAAHGQKRQDQG